MKKLRRAIELIKTNTNQSDSNVAAKQDKNTNVNFGMFAFSELTSYGIPHNPTKLAYDPVQHLLAVGNMTGQIKIMGRSNLHVYAIHPSHKPITHIQFIINAGYLIAVVDHVNLILWQFDQEMILRQSIASKNCISTLYIPFKSKWGFYGTIIGNIHIFNQTDFTASRYIIYWNKLIDVYEKNHPGSIIHISHIPTCTDRILIGCSLGLIVVWDLVNANVIKRFNCIKSINYISWDVYGKNFVCSCKDGGLITWSLKNEQKSTSHIYPKPNNDETFNDISRVEWHLLDKTPTMIFCQSFRCKYEFNSTYMGILQNGNENASIDVFGDVVDFVVLSDQPSSTAGLENPKALLILLSDDIVCYDLFNKPFLEIVNYEKTDFSESPICTCQYYPQCSDAMMELIESHSNANVRLCGSYSKQTWPIDGGMKGEMNNSLELFITGHKDGKIKFWNTSSLNFKPLYIINTSKIFNGVTKTSKLSLIKKPYKITNILLCNQTLRLFVTGISHIICFKFAHNDATLFITPLCITIPAYLSPFGEISDCNDECKHKLDALNLGDNETIMCHNEFAHCPDILVNVKNSLVSWKGGYQPSCVCLLGTNKEHFSVSEISKIFYLEKFNLLIISTRYGVAIMDMLRNRVLSIVTLNQLIRDIKTDKFFDGSDELDKNTIDYLDCFPSKFKDEINNTSVQGSTITLGLLSGDLYIISISSFEHSCSRDFKNYMSYHKINLFSDKILLLAPFNEDGLLIGNSVNRYNQQYLNKMDKTMTEKDDTVKLIAVTKEEIYSINWSTFEIFYKMKHCELGFIDCTSANVCYLADDWFMIIMRKDVLKIFSVPNINKMYQISLNQLIGNGYNNLFSIGINGNILLQINPSELKLITVFAENQKNVLKCGGKIFAKLESPQVAVCKSGFFSSLFNDSGSNKVDEDVLFGSQKDSDKREKVLSKFDKSVSPHSDLQCGGTSSSNEFTKLKISLIERTKQLESTENVASEMTSAAQDYSKLTKKLLAKSKNKKWYNL